MTAADCRRVCAGDFAEGLVAAYRSGDFKQIKVHLFNRLFSA
jgi:hypothetical protein